ncbi:UNVERIFIED_CONTAM: hypothetical protein Scaly_2191000 [Sesamum calycinum]|uniref:Uncharacterized protein n=1 Tax=Sesamum calycinum TaxID=2727403 RepID=A0AAW2MMU4_9LAMI
MQLMRDHQLIYSQPPIHFTLSVSSAVGVREKHSVPIGKRMDLDSVKRLVEKEGGDYEFTVDSMPPRFIEPIVMQGLKIDHIERGRVVCSFTVPPRLLVCISFDQKRTISSILQFLFLLAQFGIGLPD